MPLRIFKCANHDTFKKIVGLKEFTAQCPHCRAWCNSESTVKVSISLESKELDKSPILSEEELNERMARHIDSVHEHTRVRSLRRKAALESMTPEQQKKYDEDVEFRRQLQEVMESEDLDQLNEAGVKIWLRSEKFEEKLRNRVSQKQ